MTVIRHEIRENGGNLNRGTGGLSANWTIRLQVNQVNWQLRHGYPSYRSEELGNYNPEDHGHSRLSASSPPPLSASLPPLSAFILIRHHRLHLQHRPTLVQHSRHSTPLLPSVLPSAQHHLPLHSMPPPSPSVVPPPAVSTVPLPSLINAAVCTVTLAIQRCRLRRQHRRHQYRRFSSTAAVSAPPPPSQHRRRPSTAAAFSSVTVSAAQPSQQHGLPSSIVVHTVALAVNTAVALAVSTVVLVLY